MCAFRLTPINNSHDFKRVKYFIHFDSSQNLKKFIKENNFSIGNTCCQGKGAHLIGVASDNEINEINKLKRTFLMKNRKKIEKTYECPVCLEILKYNSVYPLYCQHNVCNECINIIKTKNNIKNSCPLCRTPF